MFLCHKFVTMKISPLFSHVRSYSNHFQDEREVLGLCSLTKYSKPKKLTKMVGSSSFAAYEAKTA